MLIMTGPKYAVSASAVPMMKRPIAMLVRPMETIRFVPNFNANRAAIGAVTPAPSANGNVCTPADNVL